LDLVGLKTKRHGSHETPFLGTPRTIEQLKGMIIGSPEYFQKHGSINAGFLEGLYHDAPGRDIEPSAQSGWSARLDSGQSRNSVTLLVLNSPEAAAALVRSDYRGILYREADTAGLSAWAHALVTGLGDEELLALLVASNGYCARTAE
jgi:hypothetical protein